MTNRDELVACVETGTVYEVTTIITRLQMFLPEYGRTRTDEKFSEYVKEVVRLRDEFSRMKALMTEEALRIVQKVKSNWTKEEIENASGYPTV
jgi:uncharacterized protein with ATP-grasp and redox domains